MTKRKRDYRAEYARRVARGMAQGRSRSQSRGHPKSAEQFATGRKRKSVDLKRVQIALSELKHGASLKVAGRSSGLPLEQLRRYIAQNQLADHRGRRWNLSPTIPVMWSIYTGRGVREIVVTDPATKSVIGHYENAVKNFRLTNKAEYLAPYEGVVVTDATGTAYLLETDPNNIHELLYAEDGRPEEVYKFILPVG